MNTETTSAIIAIWTRAMDVHQRVVRHCPDQTRGSLAQLEELQARIRSLLDTEETDESVDHSIASILTKDWKNVVMRARSEVTLGGHNSGKTLLCISEIVSALMHTNEDMAIACIDGTATFERLLRHMLDSCKNLFDVTVTYRNSMNVTRKHDGKQLTVLFADLK